mmetsp:Transcript_77798/g.252107  ORF Transcript_77798/g.252107 Transcript_77798/m.252107 type:complete len:94 (-) Transcript_77798:59-340(-)
MRARGGLVDVAFSIVAIASCEVCSEVVLACLDLGKFVLLYHCPWSLQTRGRVSAGLLTRIRVVCSRRTPMDYAGTFTALLLLLTSVLGRLPSL